MLKCFGLLCIILVSFAFMHTFSTGECDSGGQQSGTPRVHQGIWKLVSPPSCESCPRKEQR